jgi:hypothetical protein
LRDSRDITHENIFAGRLINQKTQIAGLIALLVVVPLAWYLRPTNPAVIADTAAFVQNYPPLAVDNPQLHWWKLEASRKSEYRSNRRNIFNPVAPLLTPPSPGNANLKFEEISTGRRASAVLEDQGPGV